MSEGSTASRLATPYDEVVNIQQKQEHDSIFFRYTNTMHSYLAKNRVLRRSGLIPKVEEAVVHRVDKKLATARVGLSSVGLCGKRTRFKKEGFYKSDEEN